MPNLSNRVGWAVVVSNLTLLIGVLGWGWDLRLVVFSYWGETALIGIFATLRAFPAPSSEGSGLAFRAVGLPLLPAVVVCMMLFYGVFLACIVSIVETHPELQDPVEMLLAVLTTPALYIALAGLAVGHVSDYVQYLQKRGYERTTLEKEILLPWVRLLQIHGAILVLGLVSAFVFNLTSVGPAILAVSVVVLKTIVEVVPCFRASAPQPEQGAS